MPTPTIHPDIERSLPEIRALAREYRIERMDVFGSSCTPEFDPARSDFDFLAKFPEGYDFGPWLGRLQEFEERLAELLGRDVDVVIDHDRLKASFLALAAETRVAVYDSLQHASAAD